VSFERLYTLYSNFFSYTNLFNNIMLNLNFWSKSKQPPSLKIKKFLRLFFQVVINFLNNAIHENKNRFILKRLIEID